MRISRLVEQSMSLSFPRTWVNSFTGETVTISRIQTTTKPSYSNRDRDYLKKAFYSLLSKLNCRELDFKVKTLKVYDYWVHSTNVEPTRIKASDIRWFECVLELAGFVKH